MRRRQVVEIEDLAWCPRAVRDGGTDWLAFMANTAGMFAGAAPKIRAAMQATGTSNVIDLCSGGGGPWLTLEAELAKSGPVSVVLSDLYPNVEALGRVREETDGRVRFHPDGVDATNVPVELDGVRTMFNAFHHFPPHLAQRILADAVAKRRAIAIFEGGGRRALGLVGIPLQIPLLALFTPFVRPFRWSRIALTYLLPLIPALVVFDGTMSFLRLYLEEDLRELIRSVPGHDTYEWEIGSERVAGLPIGPQYLVGTPKAMEPAPRSSRDAQ